MNLEENAKVISNYFSSLNGEMPRLVLDGTGPGVTMHLPLLNLLGDARLQKFERVDGFSGGALAFIVFWAHGKRLLRGESQDFIQTFDQNFRSNHHDHLLSPLTSVIRLLMKKPAFGESKIRKHIRYIFSDKFLAMKASDLPENFVCYVAVNKSTEIETVDHAYRLKNALDMESLLSALVAIPFAYGAINGSYYDAVYGPDFRSVYAKLTKDNVQPTLVLSMRRSGAQANTTFIRPTTVKNAKSRLKSDSLRLLLNFPNSIYADEIRAGLR